MITLLLGDNSFELEQELGRIASSFDGGAEKFDGAALELGQLPDLLMGLSLFAQKRLVIIRALSSNKYTWEALPQHLERMSNDIDLILVETSPDKRTKTYKTLQKAAVVKDFQVWGERDSSQAQRWILDEAGRMNMKLDAITARAVLDRCFVMSAKGQSVVDQWQIKHALEKLSVFDSVTPEIVEKYIDEHPVDSVFSIFETALKANSKALHQLIRDIEPREDAFKVFGLLSSQMFQLATLASSNASSADIAKAIGVHPYAASKLNTFAKKLTKRDIRRMVLVFAEADEALKLSKADPWVLIEQALMKFSQVAKGK